MLWLMSVLAIVLTSPYANELAVVYNFKLSAGGSDQNLLVDNGPSRSNNLLGIISHHPYNEDIM